MKQQKPSKSKASIKKRAYRQEARAQQASASAQGITDATVAPIRSVRRLTAITLDDIARDSGLTVRTILRRFGSRDGVMDAAFAQLQQEFEAQRPPTPPGDVEAALASLLNQYEHVGDLNIRALEEADQYSRLHGLLEVGRAYHRQWLEHVFGPHLVALSSATRERSITALYAATDVYLWKLMRRDLRLSKNQTADVFRLLVGGVVKLQDYDFLKGGK